MRKLRKIPAQYEQDTAKYVHGATAGKEIPGSASEGSTNQRQMVCGYPASLVFVLLASIVVAAAGAIGGGVGGSISTKHCRGELSGLRQGVSSPAQSTTKPKATSSASSSSSSNIGSYCISVIHYCSRCRLSLCKRI